MSWARADALESKACMGKHRTGTGGMQFHQSYLWTQSSYLAHQLTTVRASAKIPLRMWKAADMFRLLCPVFYFIFLTVILTELIWLGDRRKLESEVKFRCSQEAEKITFFWRHISKTIFSPPPWLSHMGMFSYWLQSWWKEWLCCCVNHGNNLHTLHFRALLVLLPHPCLQFNATFLTQGLFFRSFRWWWLSSD